MIDGINIMMTTQMLETIRKQVKRGDEHSSIRVLDHLHKLADAAAGLALAIRDRIGPSEDAYSNASQGGP